MRGSRREQNWKGEFETELEEEEDDGEGGVLSLEAGKGGATMGGQLRDERMRDRQSG